MRHGHPRPEERRTRRSSRRRQRCSAPRWIRCSGTSSISGLLGPDKGKGGKYLFLPPDYSGEVPEGYFVVKSPTYSVEFRNARVQGGRQDRSGRGANEADQGLSAGPGIQPADDGIPQWLRPGRSTQYTPTRLRSSRVLAQLVNEEPAEVFTPLERFYMQAIGIEKGQLFKPDAKARTLLSNAARVGGAMARANSFASPDADTYYYKDRKWQYVGEVPYTFNKDGVLEVDRRAYVYYMALGNSPAMMSKNVGVGSYYLWTYKDAAGGFLDGAATYKLHIPAEVPAKDFWSVLVYDSLSRSELKNGQKFPSVSKYTRSPDQRRRLGRRLFRSQDAGGPAEELDRDCSR